MLTQTVSLANIGHSKRSFNPLDQVHDLAVSEF
jgi:hypothetical protein